MNLLAGSGMAQSEEAMVLKRSLKRGAQVCVSRTAPLLWRSRGPALVVPVYHRVLPEEDARLSIEQPGMYVHPETFRMHVRTLKQHFEIVRLAEWIERAAGGRPLPRLACAITFDDGWRDNYEHAYPILREEGVPATIFACSEMVGTWQMFWPERLALLLRRVWRTGRSEDWLERLCPSLRDEAGISIESIDAAINRAKHRYSDEEITRLLDAEQEEVSGPDLLDWQQLGEMMGTGAVDIGSHTRRHVRILPGLNRKAMHDEIVESKRVLEERTGARVALFCYPNGDRTPEAHELVKKTYRGACVTRRGWNSAAADPFMIRRVGIHQDVSHDQTAFLSRISTWF